MNTIIDTRKIAIRKRRIPKKGPHPPVAVAFAERFLDMLFTKLLEVFEEFPRKLELFLAALEEFVWATFVKTFVEAAFVKGFKDFAAPRVVVPRLLTAPRVVAPKLLTAPIVLAPILLTVPTAELKILAAVLVTVLFTELKVLFAAFPRLLIPGKPFIPMYH